MQPDIIGGRYRVQRAIGQGGMGTVWLCHDEMLAREVAVKQVGRLPGQSVTDTARAMREARSSAALSHRNVVSVFDVVHQDDSIWMVMEHVPSRTLSEVIRDEGRLSPAEVAALGAQVADGLAAAHASGITHRDVKPGNVLVTDDGVAKIGDFGLSRTVGDPALTQSGMVTGTPSYFSPELATGAEPAPPADVWALGATLYAAVEGRPPYTPRANPVAVLHEIAHERPPAPRHAGPLEPVLMRMLDADPETRWSMSDAAHGLHRVADRQREHTSSLTDELPVAPAPAPSPAPSPAPDRGPAPSPRQSEPSRRRGGLVLAGVLALLVAVAAAVLVDRTLGGEQTSASPEGRTREGRSASPDTGGATRTPSAATPQAAGRGAAAVAFVDGYFDTVPDDMDAGWAQLSPGYQAETGRSSYDAFWSSVESVDATDLTAVRGGRAVEATVTYVYGDGRTVGERQRLHLVGPSTDPRIDGYDTL